MKEEEKLITTIENACPNCKGDIFDGTGIGWYICKECNEMF